MSQSIVCPSCRYTFHPLNTDKFSYFGCPFCGAFFVDDADEPKRTLRCFDSKVLELPALAPTTEGELEGTAYTVAGIIGKCEQGDQFVQWYEYILFAQDGSTATLVEFNGHWMLIKAIPDMLTVNSYAGGVSAVEYAAEAYPQYHTYKSKVTYASGAFDWNILDDEEIQAREFIQGTRLLVEEQANGERERWYLGAYIEPESIATAFGLPRASLPARTGVGVIQPNPYERSRKPLLTIAMVFVVLIGVFQLVLTEIHPTSTLLNQEFLTEPDSAGSSRLRPIMTQPFHLQYPTAVNVHMRADVSNDWLEVTALLVNEASGQVHESSKSLEKYEGYDDEGSWSEDNSDKDIVFSSIPPGNYHLNLIPASEGGKSLPLTVRVTHSNWILSNFILILIAIISVPAINQISYKVFEQKRFL